jgi:hypothetical protein
VTSLLGRLSASALLTDPVAEGDVVEGRAWLEGLDSEALIRVDTESEDGEEVDLDALVEYAEGVVGLSGKRWVAIVDEVSTELEEAAEEQGAVTETSDLRTELTLVSVTVLPEATLLRFVAPRQFPDSVVLVQLDEDHEINDLSVVEAD